MPELAGFCLELGLPSTSASRLHASEGEPSCQFDVLFLVDVFWTPSDLIPLLYAGYDGDMLWGEDTALGLNHQLALNHMVLTTQTEHEGERDQAKFDYENSNV